MRFLALDGLRGCCALLIVLLHCNYLGHFYSLPFVRNSYLFVDFFFVLSGFVISAAYADKLGAGASLGKFALRRIGRLWPLHIAVLGAFAADETLKSALSKWLTSENPPFTGDHSIASIFTNVLLIQSFGIHDHLTWNHPSWSVSVELVAYLLFALVMVYCRRFAAIIFALLALCGFSILFLYSPRAMNVTFDYGVARGIYGFFLGCLVYRFYLHRKTYRQNRAAVLQFVEMASVTGVILFVSYCGVTQWSLLAPLIFLPTIYVFACERGWCSQLLLTGPLQTLGKWSYSIYMIHFFVHTCLNQILKPASHTLGFSIEYRTGVFGEISKVYASGSTWAMDGMALAYIGIVVALSALTFRYVETPGREFFNRIADKRHVKPAAMFQPAIPLPADAVSPL